MGKIAAQAKFHHHGKFAPWESNLLSFVVGEVLLLMRNYRIAQKIVEKKIWWSWPPWDLNHEPLDASP